MSLLVPLLIVLGGLALVVALVATPGAVITYRRKRANARAIEEIRDEPPEPFLHDAVDDYVTAVGKAGRDCLEGIEAALALFEERGRAHYGEAYAQRTLPGVPIRTHGTPGDLLRATRVALVRLRVGFYEPVHAYRPGNTPTSLQGMRGLRDLLAAEVA